MARMIVITCISSVSEEVPAAVVMRVVFANSVIPDSKFTDVSLFLFLLLFSNGEHSEINDWRITAWKIIRTTIILTYAHL